ncbi:MAG: MBL fold metallo-hydrolase [Lewinellaceae bacterium]|nr:MBL fold metallo-hydrolase [Lewinellaceae bacterium]
MLEAYKDPCKRFLTTTVLVFLLSAVAAISQKGAVPFVIVLGTAQDAGYPQAGCEKDCCRPAWAQPALRRLVSSIAIVDPESGDAWMVDATPDFPEQLHRLEHILPGKPVRLKGIFLTHAHIGHYTGLMHLGREVMGAKALPVYAMPRMRSFLENNGPWSQLVALENIEIRNLSADSTISLNERLSITPVQVPHRDEFSETVGFKIDGPEKSLLFIPDIDKWERWGRDIRTVLKTVDFALLDGTFYQNGEIPGRDMGEIPHPFISESMALFADLPPAEKAKVHFIHFNHTNPVLLENSGARGSVEGAGFGICGEGANFKLSSN